MALNQEEPGTTFTVDGALRNGHIWRRPSEGVNLCTTHGRPAKVEGERFLVWDCCGLRVRRGKLPSGSRPKRTSFKGVDEVTRSLEMKPGRDS